MLHTKLPIPMVVGRHAETQLLWDLQSPDTPKKILLLEGGSGYGKSTLLHHYRRLLSQQQLDVALLDLQRTNSYLEFLIDVVNALDRSRFPTFEDALQSANRRAAQLRQADQYFPFRRVAEALAARIANPSSEVPATGLDEELTQYWFRDLQRSWPKTEDRVTLLIDSYETGSAQVTESLQSRFFPFAVRQESLRVVIAGRVVPNSTFLQQHAVTRQLGGLDARDWLEAMRIAKKPVSEDAVRAMHAAAGGNARLMAGLLYALDDVVTRTGDMQVAENTFVRQVEEAGIDHLYEAKLLIIGEPGAGKTSLARKIKDLQYQLIESEKTTKGIDVIPWTFSMADGKPFRVNIWDFGGQEIYHATGVVPWSETNS